MRAEEAYQWLIGASVRSDHDAFDIHVVASVFALAIEESNRAECTGSRREWSCPAGSNGTDEGNVSGARKPFSTRAGR